MDFGKRIQQLCPGVSNEQATELREFLVEASERLEAEPALMASSLKTLEQEATDQGYAWDSVVMVLQQVANASSEGDEPEQLMQAWQTCTASVGSIADFTAVLTDRFPEIHSTFVELVELAQDEHRALSGVAGGSNVGRALASPWKKTPNATQKQRRNKWIIGAAEVFTGLSIVNYSFFKLKEGVTARDLLGSGVGENYFRVDSALVEGEVKITRNCIGLPTVEYRFDHWFGAGGYFNHKINKLMPGGIFRHNYQEKRYNAKKLEERENSRESIFSKSRTSSDDLPNEIVEEDHDISDSTSEDSARFFPNQDNRPRGSLKLTSNTKSYITDLDINPRRMSERVGRAYGKLETDALAPMGGESDLSQSALSGSDQTLPRRVSAGLWDNARNSVMSDLTGDMQYAESRAEASVSADISGLEDKELGALEDI